MSWHSRCCFAVGKRLLSGEQASSFWQREIVQRGGSVSTRLNPNPEGCDEWGGREAEEGKMGDIGQPSTPAACHIPVPRFSRAPGLWAVSLDMFHDSSKYFAWSVVGKKSDGCVWYWFCVLDNGKWHSLAIQNSALRGDSEVVNRGKCSAGRCLPSSFCHIKYRTGFSQAVSKSPLSVQRTACRHRYKLTKKVGQWSLTVRLV